MPKPIPATGEAVPKIDSLDEDIVDCFKELENDFCELESMTFTLEFMLDKLVHHYNAHRTRGTIHMLELSEQELAALAFLAVNVQNRSNHLKKSYYAALDGKAVRQ